MLCLTIAYILSPLILNFSVALKMSVDVNSNCLSLIYRYAILDCIGGGGNGGVTVIVIVALAFASLLSVTSSLAAESIFPYLQNPKNMILYHQNQLQTLRKLLSMEGCRLND